MSTNVSSLKCIGCGHQAEVTTAQFRCPSCGDIYAVDNDWNAYDQIKSQLKDRFAQRLGEMSGPYRSGVWRYHELILGKPEADVFIDDKAIHHTEWLERLPQAPTLPEADG